MIHGHPESEASIPQLLDTVGKKLDSIAETLRYKTVSSERWIMMNPSLAVGPTLQRLSRFERRHDYLKPMSH